MTGPEVCISREFDAPRELVFEAWTDAESLGNWFAPRVCEVEFRRFDFREGGGFHSCIRTPGGDKCWCQGEYRRIVAGELIEFTMAVSNERMEKIRAVDAGMDPDWPQETVVTVTFEEVAGGTRITLRQTVDEDLAKRTGAHPSWLEMFDRLSERLASAV